MRVTGFKFHREFDHWECPTGQLLHRHSVDHQRNIVRYRAIGHICNCCHKKPDCTDSEEGREIELRPYRPSAGRTRLAWAGSEEGSP